MTERTAKVESIVRQTVATNLAEALGPDSAPVTVTGVDVAPDLKTAVVWVGVVLPERKAQALFKRVQGLRRQVQAEVARVMTTKFVPRLEFKFDTGSDYAQHIEKIIRDL